MASNFSSKSSSRVFIDAKIVVASERSIQVLLARRRMCGIGGSYVAAFWVSLAATLIALFATFVSYIVYRSQADPDVIVYVQADERRATIINLVIENIGRACAFDVTFTPSAVLPVKAYGFDDQAPPAELMTSGPIVKGIPFLPPGGKRVITWGQYGGLLKALEAGTITVTTSYRSQHFLVPWRSRHKTTCPLEVASFEGTDASDSNYLKHIAEDLRKIAEVAEELTSKQTSG